MSLLPIPPKLRPLAAALDALTGRASVEQLKELLATCQVTLEDVHDFVRFDAGNYQRNLVALGSWYEILVICWRSGQRSPIHNHAQSTCGLKVLTGVCSETLFTRSPCGQVVALSTSEKHPGEVCASADDDTHQVSNLQTPGHDLVTLHIYSPPLRKMKKFSITSAESEEWLPSVTGFAQGEGI